MILYSTAKLLLCELDEKRKIRAEKMNDLLFIGQAVLGRCEKTQIVWEIFGEA